MIETSGLRQLPNPSVAATAHAPDLIGMPRLTGIIRRHLRAIILCVLLGLVLALVLGITAEPRYTASATILVSPPGSDGGSTAAKDRPRWEPGEVALALANQVELLQSYAIGEKVLARLSPDAQAVIAHQADASTSPITLLKQAVRPAKPLDPETAARTRHQELIQTLQKNLQVTPSEKASTVTLAYVSPSAAISAAVVGVFLDAMQSDLGDASATRQDGYASNLADRIAQLQADRDAVAQQIQQTLRATPELAVEIPPAIGDSATTELKRELGAAIAEEVKLDTQLQQLKSVAPDGRLTLLLSLENSVPDPALQGLRQDYAQLMSLLADRETGKLRAEGRVIDVVRARLQAGTDAQFERALASTIAARGFAADHVARLRGALDAMAQGAVVLGEKRSSLQVLQSRRDVLDTTIRDLSARREALLPAQSVVRVISPPQQPLEKSGPGLKTLVVLWMTLGAVAGLACAGWSEWRDQTFRSAAQVTRLTGLPIMVEFPELANGSTGRRKLLRNRSRMEYLSALRSLDSSLSKLPTRGSRRTIAVAPAVTGGGATTTARNLAVLLARDGCDVLLVDADRHSARGLTWQMKLTGFTGLANLMAGAAPLENCIVTGTSLGCDVMPLGLVPKGSRSPIVKTPDRWRKLTADLDRCYDFVVIDMPPLSHLQDIASFAGEAEAVLVVVRWGRTGRAEAIDALQGLSGNLTVPAYAVLNGIGSDDRRRYADVV